MSDQAQGPDWWMASDGKWYPPTSRFAAGPPPPAPGGAVLAGPPGPRSLSGVLGGWLQGLMWASAAASAIGVLLTLGALSAFNKYWDAPLGSDMDEFDNWVKADDIFSAMMLLGILTWVAAFIVLVVWMNKAHKVTSSFGPGQRNWTSGWTVGGWFIPFANLVIPKLVFNEIERIASAPKANGTVTPGWRQQATMPIGWVWWAFMVAQLLLGSGANAALGGELTEEIILEPDGVRGAYLVTALSAAVSVVSGVLGAFYVRALGSRLR